MTASWVAFDAEDAQKVKPAEKSIERIKEAVRAIRNIRTEKQVPPSKKIAVIIVPSDEESQNLFNRCKAFTASLCNAGSIEIQSPGAPAPEGAVSVVVSGANIYLPMDSLVDTEKERARLSKEKQKLEQEIARIDSKLSNEGFMSKAPPALVNAEREKRGEFAAKLAQVEAELKGAC